MSTEHEVEITFNRWLWDMVCDLTRLPDGFEHVNHDDPDLFLVTDGTSQFAIELSADAVLQPGPSTAVPPGRPEGALTAEADGERSTRVD